MSLIRRRDLLLLAATALVPLPALAQNLQYDRGTILNMDWNRNEVQIKDAKDRERIWKVAKDATVKFSDKAWSNRTPTLKDLRRNMYVHFSYSSGDPEIIQNFDVKDAGQAQPNEPETKPAPAPGLGSYSGRATSVGLDVAQIEVMVDGAGRRTFQAANARVLAGLKPGDRVLLRTEKQANGQEIVVEAQRQGSQR